MIPGQQLGSHPLPSTAAPDFIRRDGWTPARKAQFLDCLANRGSVRMACAQTGISREAAYRLRRRDALFFRAWDAAILLARDTGAEVLADCALEGVEEEVWYKGELVGMRRKLDARLLLAHVARLDRLAAASPATRADAARFEEMLAAVSGVAPSAELAAELPQTSADPLPPAREAFVAQMVNEEECVLDAEDESAEEGEGSDAADPTDEHRSARLLAARRRAERLWDDWRIQAAGAVDALLAQPGEQQLAIRDRVIALSDMDDPAQVAFVEKLPVAYTEGSHRWGSTGIRLFDAPPASYRPGVSTLSTSPRDAGAGMI